MNNFNYVDYDPFEIRKTFEKGYEEIVGCKINKGDPISDFLDFATYITTILYSKINETGKMNLLRYAKGPFLDALGEIPGEVRGEAKKALTTIKYTFSKPFESVVIIPKGHKTTARGLYFETISATELKIGETTTNIRCECATPGTLGNGFGIGEIITIVDGIPFLESVTNLTVSQGGAEKEDDESFREKIRANPTARSVAGPATAYIYHTKKSNHDISDVFVTTTKGTGIVKIYPLMKNGEIPGSDVLESIKLALENKEIKPLTDQVQVLAPGITNYDINVKYFIEQNPTADIELIKKNIENSVNNYINWQHEKLGRDINPSKLITMMTLAGAKRIEIIAPSFTKLEKTNIAKLKNKAVVYGGVEVE